MRCPPTFKGNANLVFFGHQAGVAFDGWLEHLAVVQLRTEVEITFVTINEHVLRIQAVSLEQTSLGCDFGLGDASEQVGTHIVRLGLRCVVHVTTDIQVVSVLAQHGNFHHIGQTINLAKLVERSSNLLDVLGEQETLRPPLAILAIGINEQHLPLAFGRLAADSIGSDLLLLAQNKDTGGDRGAVKQVGWQTNHCFQQIILDDACADAFLFTSAEQHAVR
ncbi:hypothetical protein D3C84_643570 [compost metagenome]